MILTCIVEADKRSCLKTLHRNKNIMHFGLQAPRAARRNMSSGNNSSPLERLGLRWRSNYQTWPDFLTTYQRRNELDSTAGEASKTITLQRLRHHLVFQTWQLSANLFTLNLPADRQSSTFRLEYIVLKIVDLSTSWDSRSRVPLLYS